MADLTNPEPADDDNRCESTHWSLPVQCVLPSSHRENWHEAWHPETGNRLRYRYPGSLTEELHHGEWHPLFLPKPGDPITTADQLRAVTVGTVLLDSSTNHGSAEPGVWVLRSDEAGPYFELTGTEEVWWPDVDDEAADMLKRAPFRVLHTPGGDRG